MTLIVVELEYYETSGAHAGSTEYRTSKRTLEEVKRELSSLNTAGRMPDVGGPLNGFVALNIIGKRKDSMALVTLRGMP